MSKKKNSSLAMTKDEASNNEIETIKTEKVKEDKKSKTQKNVKNTKNGKNKKEKGSLKRKAKETFSELKKVTWPTFGEVCKKTGVVLVVVLIFAVIIFGMDYGLGALMKLLTKR